MTLPPTTSGDPDPEWVVLGHDPFAEPLDADPFLEGLERLGLASAHRRATPSAAEAATRPAPAPEPPRPGRRSELPPLSELDAPEVRGLLEHWLSPEERRRLAALEHLVDGEALFDRFGFSPEAARRAFPYFYALHRFYFRVDSVGAEHLPARGPAVLAANHGGLLPFDGAMVVTDALLRTDPPRLVRAVVDRWAGSLPFVNVFLARVGQVVGTRENFADLLADGQLVLVFPEGMHGILKPIHQRYRLQGFHVGFVEEALRAGAPVVPMAVIGSDDQAPILHDFRGLARRLGLPSLPVTPTFPWLGPLGLLPYPVPYRIVYGEPLHFEERFGPEDARDGRLVQFLARQVRREVQGLVDRHR